MRTTLEVQLEQEDAQRKLFSFERGSRIMQP
jgi:hypothetical protein